MIESATSIQAGGLSAAGATDRGRLRTGNEDRHHIDLERGIFLVADGVGGHAAGEVAAAIAVDVILQRLQRAMWTPAQRVREAIALANNEIFKQSERSPEHAGMTCVLTLALLADHRLTIGHVGDSRLYKFTPTGLIKVTHDHSPIGEREDAGEISELEAMQHPRRNEVFRDVGSTFHEPDDPDFIELIETSFDPESAILLCSDGLSDMVPSMVIDRTVRQHAGDPAAVVEALIDAANDAGGKDNITAVYFEGAQFGAAVKPSGPSTQRGSLPSTRWRSLRAGRAGRGNHSARTGAVQAGRGRVSDSTAATTPDTSRDVALDDELAEPSASSPARRSRVWVGLRRFGASRGTWLAAGLLSGLALGLGLVVMLRLDVPLIGQRGRTLVVGRVTPGQFTSIGAALAAAGPQDVVQIEPGEYMESVVVKDGVDLVARVPGTVTLVAPSGYVGWVSMDVNGRLGNRVAGVRVLGRPGAPVDVGIRVAGHDIQFDDVTVEGELGVGMDIVADGAILVRASRFADVQGMPMRIGAFARPVIRQNVFVRRPPEDPKRRAIEIASNATPQLSGNLFVGYPGAVSSPALPWEQILRDNYVIRSTDYGR